jgi:DNA repair protein SbcD/Mre11
MKIAITADIHLKTDTEAPERLHALKDILFQVRKEEIGHLIIAGDLFDAESRNYGLFDSLCKEADYKEIIVYVVPGNHDGNISSKYFTAGNIRVMEEPQIIGIKGFEQSFLFIPYIPGMSMGQAISSQSEELTGPWILIGHGDYLSGIKEPNLYEKGIYMPLSSTEVEYYRPSKVFLGHIHKSAQLGKVYYPGSACGMDINETGKRTFFILDAEGLQISERIIDTDVLFFQETLTALPGPDEFVYIKESAQNLIAGWGLGPQETDKAKIRIKVNGYTSDKKMLSEVLESVFDSFHFLNGQGPDTSDVSLFDDPEKISIVEKIKKEIDCLELEEHIKAHVLAQSLRLILEPK